MPLLVVQDLFPSAIAASARIDEVSDCGEPGESYTLPAEAAGAVFSERWQTANSTRYGWIIMLNFREHVLSEFKQHNLDYYFLSGGELNDFNWRRFSPGQLFGNLCKVVQKRLA